MIALIGLVFEVSIFVAHADGRFALYNTAIFENGYFGRNHRQYMHVIWLNVHLNYFDRFQLGISPDTVTHLVSHRSSKYHVAVYGHLNDMVLAVPDGMW